MKRGQKEERLCTTTSLVTWIIRVVMMICHIRFKKVKLQGGERNKGVKTQQRLRPLWQEAEISENEIAWTF